MAVVMAGMMDTSVDESLDGISGASARNPYEEMVTVK